MRQTEDGVLLEIKVKTNSSQFDLYEKDGKFILEIKGKPIEGRANIEIVKELSKMFGKNIRIVRGLKSRDKLILIENAKLSDIRL